jgi:hypothetical protein
MIVTDAGIQTDVNCGRAAYIPRQNVLIVDSGENEREARVLQPEKQQSPIS